MTLKKIIFVLLISILIPATALAWDDCPHNEINCPAPGDCERYIDTDNDGICDHSQPAPEDRNSNMINTEIGEEVNSLISGKDIKTKTVNEIAEIYQINKKEYSEKLSEHLGVDIKPENSFQLLHDNYGLEPSAAKDIAASIKLGTQINIPETTESGNKQSEERYHLLLISLFLIILYAITHILSKKKIISVINHRKIWNILLLITFLISGILGILLVIRINFGIAIPLPFNILFWHVEVGIAMFVISIFHTLWHWAYFKNLFRARK